MIRFSFMTCSLHVHHMFNEMNFMVRHGSVKFLIIFCMDSFFIMSFIMLGSYRQFWAVVRRLTWKISSDIGPHPLNWRIWATTTWRECCAYGWRFITAPLQACACNWGVRLEKNNASSGIWHLEWFFGS